MVVAQWRGGGEWCERSLDGHWLARADVRRRRAGWGVPAFVAQASGAVGCHESDRVNVRQRIAPDLLAAELNHGCKRWEKLAKVGQHRPVDGGPHGCAVGWSNWGGTHIYVLYHTMRRQSATECGALDIYRYTEATGLLQRVFGSSTPSMASDPAPSFSADDLEKWGKTPGLHLDSQPGLNDNKVVVTGFVMKDPRDFIFMSERLKTDREFLLGVLDQFVTLADFGKPALIEGDDFDEYEFETHDAKRFFISMILWAEQIPPEFLDGVDWDPGLGGGPPQPLIATMATLVTNSPFSDRWRMHTGGAAGLTMHTGVGHLARDPTQWPSLGTALARGMVEPIATGEQSTGGGGQAGGAAGGGGGGGGRSAAPVSRQGGRAHQGGETGSLAAPGSPERRAQRRGERGQRTLFDEGAGSSFSHVVL